MAKTGKPRHPLHVLRVIVQLAFLGLFLALLAMTMRGVLLPGRPWLAHLFLISDPLALAAAIAAGTVSGALLAGLAVLVLSLILPRAYCGWVCPLGTTMDIADRLLFRRRDRSKSQTPRLRQAKYGLLAALLVLAAMGHNLFGWVDPISIATRAYALALHPMADRAAKAGLVAAEEAGAPAAAHAYDWARRHRLLLEDADLKEDAKWYGYRWGGAFLAILLGIVLVQAYQKRFWCRNLCPLGALLGLVGSASPLRPRVSRECISCNRCREGCKTGAFEPRAGEKTYRGVVQECISCYACERAFCPVGAIHIGWGRPRTGPVRGVLPGRRAFLASAAAGAVAGPALALDLATRRKEESNPMLRPPGALRPDEQFQAACIRCGACMRACPKNALHPAGLENGLAGLWASTFVFNIGHCEYFCAVTREEVESGAAGRRPANLCGIVCPTGAIAALTQDEKAKWKIGTAEFDKDRCLPWARGESCLTCEEQCPLPEKAISHQMADVPNPDWLKMSDAARNRFEQLQAKRAAGGLSPEEEKELAAMPPRTRRLALPYVLRDRCTGCGVCENVCPVEGPSGVRVQRLLTRDIR
jgi:polyferredoxin